MLGTVGTGNMANLQVAVASTIAAGESMGMSANQSVAALFLQLQAMGIDTANLLAKVAGVGGTSFKGIQDAMGSASPQTQAMANYMGAVADRAKKAAEATAGRGGGRGKKSLAGGARQAKEEVKTLLDYANDLADVWGRAFEIRFGADKVLDNITSAVQEVADKTAEAQRNIQKLNAEIQGLNSDKSSYQYFLGVAEMYGDTLRATEIRAKLAEIDSDLADKSADVADETAKTNKTLVGNSKAAISNRDTITGLVSSYQELIGKYAASGMSQAELANKTAQLKAQFLQQATQLGYNATELDKYAASFDDVALAISRVPRNITVSMNINPALQALAEFEARAAQAARNASNSIASGGGSGYGMSVGDGYGAGYEAGKRYMDGWIAASARRRIIEIADASVPGGKKYTVQGSGQWFFKKGGYTGDVGTSQQAGVVHGKEFVVNAENTAKFRPILEGMNRGQLAMPMVNGYTAPSVQVVELSALDRQLLANAGNVSLSIDGRVVANATNGANFVSTSRGSN